MVLCPFGSTVSVIFSKDVPIKEGGVNSVVAWVDGVHVLDHELCDGLAAIGHGFPMLVGAEYLGEVMGFSAEEI
jgi:hypothetical protein